ncbi:hypothetical protein T01_9876 [Trichinella spiralis]|uniref:Uncharacterized protein n=1 Tax=Trichinella spiralis TaxID=6334 RepID=A0A0V1AVV2_TRISP|nr:hypothetical protein T01_9876 [Trichinella spiralis]
MLHLSFKYHFQVRSINCDVINFCLLNLKNTHVQTGSKISYNEKGSYFNQLLQYFKSPLAVL